MTNDTPGPRLTEPDASGLVVLAGVTMNRPRLFELGCGTAVTFSHACPHGDRVNEDAAALIPFDQDRAVLAVADGAGGLPAGEDAARLALQSLCQALEDARGKADTLRDVILDGFERANQTIMSVGVGAATTLVAVELSGARLRSYHAGDSAVLVTGQRGKLKLSTMPHSPTGYAIEAGLLTEEDALQHDDRNLVSNLVGSPDMRIEVGPTVRLAPFDTVVVASDGLFDNLTTDDIVERVRVGPIVAAADSLARECLRRMREAVEGQPSKADDLTLIVYRRQRARRPAPPGAGPPGADPPGTELPGVDPPGVRPPAADP